MLFWTTRHSQLLRISGVGKRRFLFSAALVARWSFFQKWLKMVSRFRFQSIKSSMRCRALLGAPSVLQKTQDFEVGSIAVKIRSSALHPGGNARRIEVSTRQLINLPAPVCPHCSIMGVNKGSHECNCLFGVHSLEKRALFQAKELWKCPFAFICRKVSPRS